MPNLRPYVKQMQKRGYKRIDIENFLVGRGYAKEDIRAAFARFTKIEIIAMSMVGLAIITLIVLLLSMTGDKEPIRDYEPRPTPPEIDEPITDEPELDDEEPENPKPKPITASRCETEDKCLREEANEKSNPEICLQIGATMEKDGCLADLALAGKPSLCNQIEDTYLRDGCNILTE